MRNNRRSIPKEKSLAYKSPDLVKEWDSYKNGDLTPSEVSYKSNKKVWWNCIRGHSYDATIANRSSGRGCSYCDGKKISKDNCLATLNPELSKEWDYDKNCSLTPESVTAHSNKKVFWICKNGHGFSMTLANRSCGSGCPYCSGNRVCLDNCLATLYPLLAKEWHPTKNGKLTPYDVTPFSGTKAWWFCDKGHVSNVRISSRIVSKCGYCGGRIVCKDNCLATTHPDISKEWHPSKNGKLTTHDVTHGMVKKVWWKCCRCGRDREAFINDMCQGKGCECYSSVVLQDDEICDSLVEALFYLKYREDGVKFLHRGLYGEDMGLHRYDFYLIDSNTYIEVTSFFDHPCLNGSYINYQKYFQTITKKKTYVENVLMASFKYIQYKPTPKEYIYVKQNMKLL